MSNPVWLRPADCALLQGSADTDAGNPVALRLVQRLLELPLMHQQADALAKAALEEMTGALRAETAAILEAMPQWTPHWLHQSRPARGKENWPTPLLAEVLDKEAAVAAPPAAGQSSNMPGTPAWLAVCLGYRERANRVLVI